MDGLDMFFELYLYQNGSHFVIWTGCSKGPQIVEIKFRTAVLTCVVIYVGYPFNCDFKCYIVTGRNDYPWVMRQTLVG